MVAPWCARLFLTSFSSDFLAVDDISRGPDKDPFTFKYFTPDFSVPFRCHEWQWLFIKKIKKISHYLSFSSWGTESSVEFSLALKACTKDRRKGMGVK